MAPGAGRSGPLTGPSEQRRWRVGITDHIEPPADIEQEAFPQAEFHFLGDWRAEESAREQWRRMDALLVWHFHMAAQIYHDVVVQVADDADFITNVRTVFNNDHDNSSGLGLGSDKEYWETFEGKLIDAKGVVARYVRLYSKGSTSDDQNHYTEVEVYALPAK